MKMGSPQVAVQTQVIFNVIIVLKKGLVERQAAKRRNGVRATTTSVRVLLPFFQKA